MERKAVVVGILLGLLVFFFPKPCGRWGTSSDPKAVYMECECLGLKYREPLIGGGKISCFGLPLSHQCYHYAQTEEGIEKVSVPCD